MILNFFFFFFVEQTGLMNARLGRAGMDSIVARYKLTDRFCLILRLLFFAPETADTKFADTTISTSLTQRSIVRKFLKSQRTDKS